MATENEDQEEREDPSGDDEERVVVDLEAGEEGGEEGERETADPPRQQTRADRKRERQNLRTKNEELERTNTELRDRVSRLEGMQQQLASSMQDTQRDSRRADREGDDPLQSELDSIYDQQQAIQQQAEALGAKITDAQYAELTKRARRLDQRKGELLAARVLRQTGGNRQQDPNQAIRQGLEVAYSDVYANANAREWAKGEYNRLVNHPDVRQRQPEGLATVKLALANAQKEFGMARPAPSDSERSRYAGVARGGAGSSSKVTEVTIKKGSHQERMANLAFSHLKDPAKRVEKWAKTAGKRLAEKKVASR